MKGAVCFIALLLGTLTIATILFTEKQDGGKSVLSWRTDPSESRYRQADLFNEWQLKNGYVGENGSPACMVSVDNASNQSSLIQAVSGMGGDIIDALVLQYQPMGLCEDITDAAVRGGFALGDAYPSFEAIMSVNGRQYAASANAFCRNIWSNVDTFEKYGMAPPPEEWTPEEFERIGKEFVRRANAGKEKQDVYFIQPLLSEGYHFAITFARSLGVDLYNETLTAPQLDNEAFVKLYRCLYKWTYQDRLCPTPSEASSISSDASLGWTSFSQFVEGKYAMLTTTRSQVIPMRKAQLKTRISTSQMPMYDFKNMPVSVRSLICYKGSKRKEDVMRFFSFLASKKYNDDIIASGDGLPPNPKYALSNPEFNAPSKYPHEGNLHRNELKWAMNIGYAMPYSPYYPPEGGTPLMTALERYSAGLMSAEEAVRYGNLRYREGIAWTIERNPALRARYEADCELQKKIDERKREGRKIPKEWIKNSFYQAYYAKKGMLE